MSISAIFSTRLPTLPQTLSPPVTGGSKAAPSTLSCGNGSYGGGKLTIECSSRPQKKATAHHKKTRPRKTQLWDIKRGPAVYPPLPKMPPEWTFAPADDVEEGTVLASSSSSSSPALEIAESSE